MKKIVIIFALSGLTACRLLPNAEFDSNNKSQYLHSRNGANLVISPPLSDQNISDFYQLPTQNKPAKISISAPVITPPSAD